MRTLRFLGGILCGLNIVQSGYCTIDYDYYSQARPIATVTTVFNNAPRHDPLQEFRDRMHRDMLAPPRIHYQIPQAYPQHPLDFDPSVPPLFRHTHPEARNEYAGKTDSISPALHAYFQNCSPGDFREYFDRRKRDGHVHSDHEILEHHNLYQYTNFVDFIRTLDGYESYIVELEHRHGHQPSKTERRKARRKVKHTEGFSKGGFAFWIARESERIIENRRKAEREVEHLAPMLSRCTQSQQIPQKAIDELFENVSPGAPRNQMHDHDDIIDYFQVVQKDISAPDHMQELAQVGEEYATWCINNPDYNSEQYHRYAKRIEILHEALHDTTHEHRSYELSPVLQEKLTQHDIEYDEWALFDGTPVQHQLHKELVQVTDDTARIDQAFGSDMYVEHLAAFVYRFGDLAHEHKKLYNMRVAYSLSDFCHGMHEACVNVAHNLRGAYLYTATVVNTIEHIATRSLDLLGKRAIEITKHIKEHPIATAGELVGFATVPSLMLAKTCFDMYQSREGLGALLDQFKETCSEDPAEAAAQTISFLVETLIVGKAQNKCTSLIQKGQKHAAYFAKVAAKESKVAQHLNKMGKQATRNIELMAARSMDALNVAMKEGVEATRKALITLANNQEFLYRKPLNPKELISFFAQHNIPLCEINWKHILYPVSDVDGVRGYHFTKIFKCKTEIIKKADRFGITMQKYFHEKYSKVSSFFPEHWTEQDLVKNIQEAYHHIVDTTPTGFIGRSSNGTFIQFALRKAGAPNNLKQVYIHTIYPVHISKLSDALKTKYGIR